MNEDKATRYHRLGRRASVISAATGLALLLGLMPSGGSAALRDLADETAALQFYLSEYQPIVVGLYILLLSLIVDTVLLPIAFYKGYVLERRYGLATQTPAHWLNDYTKTVV